jgi:hypothetical protein
MDTKQFAEAIVSGLGDHRYPERRNPHERKNALHFDHAPIHNTRTAMGQLEHSAFKGMEHPAYSPDLAHCASFFGYMKEQPKGRGFGEEEELLSVLSELMSEIPLTCLCGSLPTGIEGDGFVF